MRTKRCYALLCAYDGGAFAGFQRHPPSPTIQGALEDALRELGWKSRVEGAGRTDRGVHACRQVVAFRTREDVPVEKLPNLLSLVLPPGLEVIRAVRANPSFHPRFSAVSKEYLYRITTAEQPTEWERSFTWVLPDLRGFPTVLDPRPKLNFEAMNEFLTKCRGRHDFSLLTHPRAQGKSVRWLQRAEVRRVETEERVRYDFFFGADGFLRHQIRNTVGVAASVGLGVISTEEAMRLLYGKGDRWRGARAPGRGLTLLGVGFRREEDPFAGASVHVPIRAAGGSAEVDS